MLETAFTASDNKATEAAVTNRNFLKDALRERRVLSYLCVMTIGSNRNSSATYARAIARAEMCMRMCA